MERIKGFEFNLSGKILLIHPHKKCWEVSYKRNVVSFRVGNGESSIERNIERRDKAYQNEEIARMKVIEKIGIKINHGYKPKLSKSQSTKKQAQYQWVQQKQQSRQSKYQMQSEQTACNYKGSYFEKGNEAIRIQLDKQKVIKIYIDGNSKEKKEVRSFPSPKLAQDWCLKEQEWYKSKDFKQNANKFELTRDKQQQQVIKVNPNSQFSLSRLTDRQMNKQHSREGRENVVSSRLGLPIRGSLQLLLAQNYKQGTDPTGWYMSQKLDGVRCFWSGQFMFSRNGNNFIFPQFFTKNWPKSQLDGELFIGRGKFTQTISAVKKNVPIQKQWEQVRYLVFDAPGLKNQPFKTRIKLIESVLSQVDNPYIKYHAHRVCEGVDDLTEQLSKITNLQGQGIMLRDPHSFYENRRSKSLLKVKKFQDDEAIVLGYTDGQGKLLGMVGALRVRTDKGIQFEVGSGLTNQQRRNPPSIGSKITYRYFQFNKESGKPRFPTFFRAYEDQKHDNND